MSNELCWECGKDYPKLELFDIEVFRLGFSIKWCITCANKQLKGTERKIVKLSKKRLSEKEKLGKESILEYIIHESEWLDDTIPKKVASAKSYFQGQKRALIELQDKIDKGIFEP